MDFLGVSFTSIADENKVLYTLDVQDPHYDPSCFDFVTVEYQLMPYFTDLMAIISLAQTGTPVRVFDVQRHFPSSRNQGWDRQGWRIPGMQTLLSDVDSDYGADFDMEEDCRTTDSSFEYFSQATRVPPEMLYQDDEEQGLAPMEVEDQPPECSPMFALADIVPLDQRNQPRSPPDLLYVAFKFCDNEGRVFVIYQYKKKKNQSILCTPAYKMASDGTTDEFLNLATCLEENPQLKVLLVDKAVPLLGKFIAKFTGEDALSSSHSSVESMDTLDGSPPKQDVDGLLTSEILEENVSSSKAKAVARCQDSGFTSMPHSVSMNQQLANEEENVGDEAELAHLLSSEADQVE